MTTRLLLFTFCSWVLVAPLGVAESRILTGWGGGKPEDVVPKAAAAGFAELVVHHDDAAAFTRFIALGKQHGVDIYAWLFLGDLAAWKNAFSNAPPPLQVMNQAETESLKKIQADKSFGRSGYQGGGEPLNEGEVLDTPLLCFHDPRTLEAFQRQIREMLAFPGVKGVAFDYIGYQNYRCCRCPLSLAQLADFRRQHPELSEADATQRFSMETLVDFNNRLAANVRTLSATARVMTHIYPVYLPEPLYGNRLDVDVCAQTAAWFFEPFWSAEKITRYSQAICGESSRYHPRALGAALLGYFNLPGRQPVKSPDRLAAELQAIFAGGCTRVHVCSFNDVINTPEAEAVFRQFFNQRK